MFSPIIIFLRLILYFKVMSFPLSCSRISICCYCYVTILQFTLSFHLLRKNINIFFFLSTKKKKNGNILLLLIKIFHFFKNPLYTYLCCNKYDLSSYLFPLFLYLEAFIYVWQMQLNFYYTHIRLCICLKHVCTCTMLYLSHITYTPINWMNFIHTYKWWMSNKKYVF